MIRRTLGLGLATLLLAALAVGEAGGAAPAGPRLALVKLGVRPVRIELLTVDPFGALPQRLAGGGRRRAPFPDPFSFLSWSPDGSRIAFSALSPRRSGEGARRRIVTVDAGGGDLRPVPKSRGGFGPVFSPDGRTIAFTRFQQRRRFEAAAIWIVDLTTGAQRRLTPWRNGLEHFASSFSPDGSTLLATRQDDRRTDSPEPVALSVASGGASRLLVDGLFPVYSPDGSQIAVFREVGSVGQGIHTDLFVLDAAGTGLRRLTRTPDNDELFASWDPSGQRLAYVRFSSGNTEAASFGVGDALMQVNADGTCQTKTLFARTSGFYVPAWQPGPGREAGRIAC